MKLLTILGTRPEIIKLSCLIKKIENNLENVTVNTMQNYDKNLNQIFYKDLELKKPKYYLKKINKSPSEQISHYIYSLEKIIKKEKPNAVIFLGDTNTCYSLIAAKKNKIPIFHFEAGNRCFDERVPEEVNRRFTDHISDINFVYSEHARKNLIREGIDSYTIIKTGSPMMEVLEKNKVKILKSQILNKLNIKKNEFFLISMHREENLDNDKIFNSFYNTVTIIQEIFKKKIIISTHPRLEKKIKNLFKNKNIIMSKPFCFSDYIFLQMNSCVNLSDSGTLMEESALINSKSILLREKHERPEGIDKGVLIVSKLNSNDLIKKIKFLIKNENTFKIPSCYNIDNFSEIAIKAILSYKDYVNDFVWKKN
jgi:UDP-N-acetylglucosamine 2-epimerase (non-hydrolysing)